MYYLYGTDWLRGKLFIDELRSQQNNRVRFIHFELSQEWDTFSNALQTELKSNSLFGGSSLVVGKTEKLTKDQIKFLDLFGQESLAGTLVIWESGSKPSWKPKSKKVTIKGFNELSAAGARNWINDYIKKKQFSVSPDFVEMLCALFGARIDFMVQEIEKYTLLRASSMPVGDTRATADYEAGERHFFEWIRSVLENDTVGIEIYSPTQEQFMQYLTGLINAIRTVVLSRHGLPLGGTNPYWAKKLVGWTSAQTDERLKDIFSFLLGLDLDIRAGKVDMTRVVNNTRIRLITCP